MAQLSEPPSLPVPYPGPGKPFMQRFLDAVERVGNRVPHPAMIFVILIAVVIVLSHLFYLLGLQVTYQVVNPQTDEVETATTAARSLLTTDGIRFMFTGVVRNFMNFNAVGVIIVAMVGVGVAEGTGLVNALIRKLVLVAPRYLLTYILVFVGILSSIAADAGYLVLIPLGAAAFISVGRHPLAGLAAAFAAVASAFTVNILIVPIDGILTDITNDAIHLVNPNISIDLTANLWFSVASVIMLTVLIAAITESVVEPRLGPYHQEEAADDSGRLSAEEARGLRFAGWALLGVLVFMLLLTAPPAAPLRNPVTGEIFGNSPLMSSLIVVIALLFLACGAAYGVGTRTLKTSTDVINQMTKAIGDLSGLILLLLVISQFLAYFNYSNMGPLAAVSLSDALERANLSAIWVLLGFVIVTFIINFIVTGAVAKWALFAPIFVPLLMRLHIAPDAILAAFRVGDAPSNSITPLNAYFAMIVTFCQRYQKDAGVGTVIALMLPYVFAVLVAWIVLLLIWEVFGLPWGL